jgi:hypothetical protein
MLLSSSVPLVRSKTKSKNYKNKNWTLKRERYKMERNYSMMLKKLQLAYMEVTMKDVEDGEQCMYCWKSGCGCSENNIKNDPFINLTTVEEFKYEKESVLITI